MIDELLFIGLCCWVVFWFIELSYNFPVTNNIINLLEQIKKKLKTLKKINPPKHL